MPIFGNSVCVFMQSFSFLPPVIQEIQIKIHKITENKKKIHSKLLQLLCFGERWQLFFQWHEQSTPTPDGWFRKQEGSEIWQNWSPDIKRRMTRKISKMLQWIVSMRVYHFQVFTSQACGLVYFNWKICRSPHFEVQWGVVWPLSGLRMKSFRDVSCYKELYIIQISD